MNIHEARVKVFQSIVNALVEACEPVDAKEAEMLKDDMTLLTEDLFDALRIEVQGVNGEGVVLEVKP